MRGRGVGNSTFTRMKRAPTVKAMSSEAST
jgi:hypothetical protein